MSKVSILKEFWQFLKVRKKWWLIPIVVILVLLSILLFIAHGAGPLAPFIYTIF